MPGAAGFAEPVRPAHFFDYQIADMSIGGWRAPPQPAPPISPPGPFMGVNMSSPTSAMYGAAPVPYPVYPVPVGGNVPPDADNQQSGPVQGRRQNDCCFYCHRPSHYKAECPERQHKTQAATTSKSGTRTYLHILMGGHEGTCLLDTGCDHSMLPRRLVPNTPLTSTNIHI